MAIRLSGLSSGLDTESIVKELMSAQSLKMTKISNKKTKLEWKEEKWKDLNKKIYSLYTDELSKLKLQSSYLTKSATSSDSSKATVTAGANVPTGTHSVEIQSVASSQFITGAKIDSISVGDKTVKGSSITSNTKLSDLGITAGTVFTLKVNSKEAKELTVTNSTKISDLTKFAKEQGVDLTYDTTNQRFFASSIESGTEHAFSLTSKMASQDTSAYMSKLKEMVGYDHLSANRQEMITKELNTIATASDTQSPEYVAAVKTLKLYADAYQKTKDDSQADDSADVFNQTFENKILENSNKNDFDVENIEVETNAKGLKDCNASNGQSALSILGLGEIGVDGIINSTSQASFVKAENCKVIYNNAVFESSTNTVKINGLTINAIEKTDSPIKINVTNDSDSVYKVVKNFVSAYNKILKELNDLYYAGSAKGYDVLTEEERDAMTDEQIEKWENKIKDSLFRSDTTLGGIRSSLISLPMMKVSVNGKDYSLSSFGIGTTDYTEKGILHIDGDSEDSAASDNKDKLQAAINSDPDTVMQVFTEIGNQLYKTLGEKMSSTNLSSALTVYNDKQITSQKKNYDNEISKWEEKLKDMEDRYYAKFSAMETAMAKMNSQTSYISSMFGTY